MDQETRWLTRYNVVVEFINTNHRNPSKHRIEEHGTWNTGTGSCFINE